MAVTNLKGNGQLRTRRIELDVPHLGKTKTFVPPLIGPNYHEDVMEVIDSQKLYRPTTAEVLSFTDLALQNPEEPHCAEILNRFRNQYLWTGTESVAFPGGVIVYYNTNGKMPQTSEGLLKLIGSGDPKVRLVKPGFKTGCMPISEFLKHPYTIAQIGEEMIPIAERVAKACHKREAYVCGLDKSNTYDDNRQTAFCSDRAGGRLSLCGDFSGGGRRYHGGNNSGYASGVLK